jgi:superfamily II DNA/RNA helicase
MNFSDLGLSEEYAKRLAANGIESPTPIQKSIFSPIITGDCILGLAKTGTGKTLSYLGPLVQKIGDLRNAKSELIGPAAIILVPTRELASQVESTHFLLTETKKDVAVVVGGEAEESQIDASGHAPFVVATPGRLLDLLKRKKIPTQLVDVVVMDEADRLLDMGFVDDIRAILRFLPKTPQLICVSATLHLGVEEVAYEMGLQPVRFGVEEEEATVSGLQHRLVHLGDTEKFHMLANFIFERKDKRGIVFSNYRDKAHELSSRLRGLGCRVDALSAQLSQGQRKKITEAYRNEKTKVLVASDLAARGLDFLDIDYVVNFDLPEDPATYVHRVGRTARAGKEGTALSLVGFEDAFRVERLERFLGEKIESIEVDSTSLEGALPRFGPRLEADPGASPRRPDRHHQHSSQNARRGPQGAQRGSDRKGRRKPFASSESSRKHTHGGQMSGHQTRSNGSSSAKKVRSKQSQNRPVKSPSIFHKILAFLGLRQEASASPKNLKKTESVPSSNRRGKPKNTQRKNTKGGPKGAGQRSRSASRNRNNPRRQKAKTKNS